MTFCFFFSQVAKLEEELSTKTRTFQLLEDKLKTQEDYEEVKRELGLVIQITQINKILKGCCHWCEVKLKGDFFRKNEKLYLKKGLVWFWYTICLPKKYFTIFIYSWLK